MPKSIAKSCPLCLSVNDPADMLPVMMAHSTPPQSAPMYLCRLCVIQIMKSTLESDVVDPGEVFELTQEEFRPRAAPGDAPTAAAEADPAVTDAVEREGKEPEITLRSILGDALHDRDAKD